MDGLVYTVYALVAIGLISFFSFRYLKARKRSQDEEQWRTNGWSVQTIEWDPIGLSDTAGSTKYVVRQGKHNGQFACTVTGIKIFQGDNGPPSYRTLVLVPTPAFEAEINGSITLTDPNHKVNDVTELHHGDPKVMDPNAWARVREWYRTHGQRRIFFSTKWCSVRIVKKHYDRQQLLDAIEYLTDFRNAAAGKPISGRDWSQTMLAKDNY